MFLLFLNQALEILTLHGNQLTAFPVWTLSANPSLSSVHLSSNPWSCECGYLQKVQRFLSEHRNLIQDADRLECVASASLPRLRLLNTTGRVNCGDDVMAVSFRTETSGVASGSDIFASDNQNDGSATDVLNRLIPLVAIVCASCVIVLSLIIMAVAFRKPVSVW